MDFIFVILGLLGSVISMYSLVCLVRVFITWMPSLSYSTFGRLLAQICDPWMNLFRRFNFLKNSRIDISPIISIGVLMLISTILKEIARYRTFSLGMIFVLTLGMLWQIISSLLMFFNILVLIRLVAELFNKNTGSLWYSIDQVLNPVISKITGIFSKNRFMQLKFSLMITLVCGVLIQFFGGMLISFMQQLFL